MSVLSIGGNTTAWDSQAVGHHPLLRRDDSLPLAGRDRRGDAPARAAENKLRKMLRRSDKGLAVPIRHILLIKELLFNAME
jgi:hypothetical protein